MNIIDLIQELGYTPKRKASTHGGEYSSPCPFCKDGNDRFLVWPNRSNKNSEYQGGRFSCRVCQKYGDAITFLCEFQGMSYKDACAKLRIEPRKRSDALIIKREIKPSVAEDPSELWKVKGLKFVEWCHAQLLANLENLALVIKRGFTIDSIKKFKIGFCPKDFFREREEWGLNAQLKEDGTLKKQWLPAGLVIPTFSHDQVIKIKIRRLKWREGDKLPKYVEVSGSKTCSSIYGNLNLKVALVLESELDALLVQQEANDLVYCVALGGSTKSLDFYTDQLLRSSPLILFCPDFDKAGAIAWLKWKKMFPNIYRILTPDGKDPSDAFLAEVDLREWIKLALNKPI